MEKVMRPAGMCIFTINSDPSFAVKSYLFMVPIRTVEVDHSDQILRQILCRILVSYDGWSVC